VPPERMVTVAVDLPLRLWLRLRQEARQRAWANGELEPETISPIVREIVEEAVARMEPAPSPAGPAGNGKADGAAVVPVNVLGQPNH
jgi:hypothetical protein